MDVLIYYYNTFFLLFLQEVYAVVNITVIDLNDNNPLVLNKDLQIEAMRNKSSVIGKLKVNDVTLH